MSDTARVALAQLQDYRFENHFDGGHVLITDEPAPLGSDTGPSPSQLLVGAVANCLSASLLFALQKYPESAAAIYAVLSAGPGWDWTTMSGLYPNVNVYTQQLPGDRLLTQLAGTTAPLSQETKSSPTTPPARTPSPTSRPGTPR